MKMRKNGVLEKWSDGVLESWSLGGLESWRVGGLDNSMRFSSVQISEICGLAISIT